MDEGKVGSRGTHRHPRCGFSAGDFYFLDF